MEKNNLFGPIVGHDLSTLLPILRNARDSKHEGPILIHIKTKKGKGYSFAEKAKDNYHGVSKFNVKTTLPDFVLQIIFLVTLYREK